MKRTLIIAAGLLLASAGVAFAAAPQAVCDCCAQCVGCLMGCC